MLPRHARTREPTPSAQPPIRRRRRVTESALILGAGGVLGRALCAAAPASLTVMALSHDELDVTDPEAVSTTLRALHPGLVVNAAASADVDATEADAEGATAVNALGSRHVAAACRRIGAHLVFVSTAEVFDGSGTTPLAHDCVPQPVTVYGASKLAGEQAVRDELRGAGTVCRTSWLYGPASARPLAELLARLRIPAPINAVADRLSVPTSGESLARTLWQLGTERLGGIHHWCDSGIATPYDFLVAVAEEAEVLGLIGPPPAIRPVATGEQPEAVQRPRYTVLDKRLTENVLGWPAPHWRTALRRVLAAGAGARA